MNGCFFYGEWKECDGCEHFDGSDCMNGEKKQSEYEYFNCD